MPIGGNYHLHPHHVPDSCFAYASFVKEGGQKLLVCSYSRHLIRTLNCKKCGTRSTSRANNRSDGVPPGAKKQRGASAQANRGAHRGRSNAGDGVPSGAKRQRGASAQTRINAHKTETPARREQTGKIDGSAHGEIDVFANTGSG